jgi:hypothetical protein
VNERDGVTGAKASHADIAPPERTMAGAARTVLLFVPSRVLSSLTRGRRKPARRAGRSATDAATGRERREERR